MRIRYTSLVKLFAFVLFFLFLVPYLLKSLDQSERSKASVDNDDHGEKISEDLLKRERKPNILPVDEVKNEIEQAVFHDGVLGNYEPKNLPLRSGPGEEGFGVHLDASEKNAASRTVAEFGFNMVASDKISLDRRIKDTRPDECKYWSYPKKLPTASVVIVFFNEGWSTLMRTVHSVINTSPPELLADIILVDDYSTKGFFFKFFL